MFKRLKLAQEWGMLADDEESSSDDEAESDKGDEAESDKGDEAESDKGDEAESSTSDEAESDKGDEAERSASDEQDSGEEETADDGAASESKKVQTAKNKSKNAERHSEDDGIFWDQDVVGDGIEAVAPKHPNHGFCRLCPEKVLQSIQAIRQHVKTKTHLQRAAEFQLAQAKFNYRHFGRKRGDGESDSD